MPRRRDPPDGLAIALAMLAGLALLASLVANAELARSYAISPRNALTQTWYPWVVRSELLVLVAFAVCLGWLATVQRWSTESAADVWRWPRRVAPALALAFIGGVLLGPATAGAVLVLYPAAVWAGIRLAGGGWSGAWPLLGTAFLVRAAVALGMSGYGLISRGQLPVWDDEMAYDYAATNVARVLAAGFGDLDFEWRHLAGTYLDGMGLVYAVLGPDFALVRLLNAALGTLSVGLVVAIGRACWPETRAAATAGWIVALWPMTVIWSASGLRESMAMLVALVVVWLVSRPIEWASRARWALAGVTGVLALAILSTLRPEATLAVCAGVLLWLALVVVRRRDRPVAPAGLAAAALLVLGALVFAGGLLRDQVSPRAIEYRAAVTQLTPLIERDPSRVPLPPAGFLPVGKIVRVPTPRGGLATGIIAGYRDEPLAYRIVLSESETLTLPREQVQELLDTNVGWLDVLGRARDGAQVLLVPRLPGGGGPLRRLVLSPDTLAWDALLVVSLVAAIQERRRLSPTMLVVLALPIVVVLELIITSSNLGTLARHRSTLVPWLALLAAPLLARVALLSWSPQARSLAGVGRPAASLPDAAPARE